MEVAQWPPRVALLKFRMALMDKAKPYEAGPDINGVFASPRARFGISTIDARCHGDEAGADRVPRSASSKPREINLSCLCAIHQRLGTPSLVSGKGSHHSRRCPHRRRSLPSGGSHAPEPCGLPPGGHGALHCSCHTKCGTPSGG